MEVKFYNPNIVVSENVEKLINDLNKANIKYTRKNDVIFFNAKLTKESPEFTVNVRCMNNKVVSINMGYNYKNNANEYEQIHKETLKEYMLSNYGKEGKYTFDETIGIESYKWFGKNSKITCNFNGAGFYEENHKENDIYLQFIFNDKPSKKFTDKNLLMISIIAGVILAAVLCLYFYLFKELKLGKVFMSVGIGIGSILVFFIVGRVILGGVIYSEKEIEIGNKMLAKFEKDIEVERRYDGKLFVRNLMDDRLVRGRIYITKEKLIIAYFNVFKIKTKEIQYKNFKQVEVKKNVLIFKSANYKNNYFEVENELIADDVYKVFKLHIK